MLQNILVSLIKEFIDNFGADKVKELVDKALDKVESKIEASENKVDDAIVLSAIKKFIREPFGIEDNDKTN